MLMLTVHIFDMNKRMSRHLYVRRFPAAVFFKEVIRAVDGHRQDRDFGLLRKLESAGLELAHLVLLRACSLREDAKAETLIEDLLGLAQRLDRLLRIVAHQIDRTRVFDHISQDRIFAPFLLGDISHRTVVFHQPQRGAYVRETLMVAVYHERAVIKGWDVLLSVNLISETKHRRHGLHPAFLGGPDQLLFSPKVTGSAQSVSLLLDRSEFLSLDISPYKSGSCLENIHSQSLPYNRIVAQNRAGA